MALGSVRRSRGSFQYKKGESKTVKREIKREAINIRNCPERKMTHV